jgi:hypothetical protein
MHLDSAIALSSVPPSVRGKQAGKTANQRPAKSAKSAKPAKDTPYTLRFCHSLFRHFAEVIFHTEQQRICKITNVNMYLPSKYDGSVLLRSGSGSGSKHGHRPSLILFFMHSTCRRLTGDSGRQRPYRTMSSSIWHGIMGIMVDGIFEK